MSSARKFTQLLLCEPKLLIKLFLLMILRNVLSPLTALILAKFLDSFSNGQTPTLQMAVTWLVLVFIIQVVIWACATIYQLQWVVFSLKLLQHVTKKAFDHLSSIPNGSAQKENITTSFAAAKKSVDTLSQTYINSSFGLFIKVTTASAIIYWNFGIGYVLLLLGLAIIPMSFGFLFRRGVNEKSKQAHESELELNAKFSEISKNILLIDIFRTRFYERNLLNQNIDSFSTKYKKLGKALMLNSTMSVTFSHFLEMIVLIILVMGMLRGEVSVGQFFLFYTYMSMLMVPIVNLPMQIMRTKTDLAHIEVLIPDHPPLPEQVTAKYIASEIIVRDFQCAYLPHLDSSTEYKFERGKIYWLSGFNGAGKSTFLRAIIGIEPQASCSVTAIFEDGTRKELDQNERFAMFSIAPQDTLTWSRSIDDNTNYAKFGQGDNLVRDSIKRDAMLKKLPELDKASRASGGQQQTMHVLRALGKNASMTLLDEPTNSLDEASIELLSLAICENRANGMTVFASHNPDFRKIADEVIHIKSIPNTHTIPT